MPTSTIPLDTDSAEAARGLMRALLKMHGVELPPSCTIEVHLHLNDRRDIYDTLVSPSQPQSLFPTGSRPFRSAHISGNAEWPRARTGIILFANMTPDEVDEARKQQEYQEASTRG